MSVSQHALVCLDRPTLESMRGMTKRQQTPVTKGSTCAHPRVQQPGAKLDVALHKDVHGDAAPAAQQAEAVRQRRAAGAACAQEGRVMLGIDRQAAGCAAGLAARCMIARPMHLYTLLSFLLDNILLAKQGRRLTLLPGAEEHGSLLHHFVGICKQAEADLRMCQKKTRQERRGFEKTGG